MVLFGTPIKVEGTALFYGELSIKYVYFGLKKTYFRTKQSL